MFHVSLLEQDNTKKGQIEEKVENATKFNVSSNGKYKVGRIWDSAVYVKKFDG